MERGLSMTDESGAPKQYRPDASINRAEAPDTSYVDAIVVQLAPGLLNHGERSF